MADDGLDVLGLARLSEGGVVEHRDVVARVILIEAVADEGSHEADGEGVVAKAVGGLRGAGVVLGAVVRRLLTPEQIEVEWESGCCIAELPVEIGEDVAGPASRCSKTQPSGYRGRAS